MKEKFENILQSEEEIIFVEGVNKIAFFLKNIFAIPVITLILFSGIYLAVDTQIGTKGTNLFNTLIIIFCIISFLTIITSILISRNLYFAITNKRIIMRSGAFNNKFIHYSLKNVGTIEVSGGILDSKGTNGSATLIISIKDFHLNTDGNAYPKQLRVSSLKKGYKAYSILSKEVDGNNESLRVKVEK